MKSSNIITHDDITVYGIIVLDIGEDTIQCIVYIVLLYAVVL